MSSDRRPSKRGAVSRKVPAPEVVDARVVAGRRCRARVAGVREGRCGARPVEVRGRARRHRDRRARARETGSGSADEALERRRHPRHGEGRGFRHGRGRGAGRHRRAAGRGVEVDRALQRLQDVHAAHRGERRTLEHGRCHPVPHEARFAVAGRRPRRDHAGHARRRRRQVGPAVAHGERRLRVHRRQLDARAVRRRGQAHARGLLHPLRAEGRRARSAA